MPQQLVFDAPAPSPGKLLHSLTVPGRLPSWNQILGMEHWARYQFKDQLQLAFLYALQVAARDYSMRITSVKSTMSIAAATLVSYREMARAKRASNSGKKKLSPEPKKKRSSKSLKSKVPFYYE